jgi:multiple sugar transport system permease protein
VFGTLAAYAFARTKSKSFNALLLVILSGRMLPGVALCIPLYILMRNLGLLDTYWALIIADTTFNLPFTIFMMSGYISQLPKEIEESGKIDGCTRLGILIYLITPLIGPGLGATAVLNFLMSWNEFLFAVVLTMSDTVKTIPVALISFDTGRNIFWGQMFAVITISLIPATLFTIFAQRYLVRGVTMGAVKG